MTRRRILNISSRKKRDTMQAVVIPDSGGSSSVTLGPGIVRATVGGTFLWCCTARDMASTGDTFTGTMQRETPTCYMVGLKENMDIITTSGHFWTWRRIIFRLKFSGLQSVDGENTTAVESSAGWGRLMRNIRNRDIEKAVNGRLFRGTEGADWTSSLTAPVDTNNCTLMYDKVRTIRSGNEQAHRHEYKQWIPMNKNLVYANDENGNTEIAAAFSSLGNAGMGDVYIIDYFDCATPTSADIQLRLSPNATLYWHEK